MSRLLRFLFKSKILEVEKFYLSCLEREKKELLKEKEKFKKRYEDSYDLASQIFTWYKDSEIIGVRKNKNNDKMFVVKHLNGSILEIFLIEESYKTSKRPPKIVCKIEDDGYGNIRAFHIDDIETIKNSCGNGSILMEYLIDIAKKLKVPYINGWISCHDSDHFDRLENYYRKFGFIVHFSMENGVKTGGRIELDIEK